MNVQHDPTPPAGTTTSRPAATTPAPTRPARYLNAEANTCAPPPTGRHNQQIPRQGSRPRYPTSDPTHQTSNPDHATGGHLMRPGRRRPSLPGGPVRPPRGTFCAQGNRLRRKRPGFVTFCAKRHPVHKMSRPAQNVPPHHPHPRDQDPRPPQTGPAPSALRGLERCGVLPDRDPACAQARAALVLMHLAVRGAP